MANPITKLFQAITEVLSDHEQTRAVTTSDIWHYVQDQLDVQAVVEAGNVSGMMYGDSMMPRSYVCDVYVDADSVFVLITKSDGKLYKAPVTVTADNVIEIGDYQEVTLEPTPVTGRGIQVKRAADGSVRWFAFPACTAVLNRVGEIDSTKLFDSFVEYTERTGHYPELDFWHLGERLVLGKADYVGRDGIAYCASGTFYETPIARAAAKALETESDYWGLSISYLPTQEPETIRTIEGIEIPVFNVGINRYISLLPEDTAASIMTSINTKEEVNRMNEKMKAALKKLTGDDTALFGELELKLDTVIRQAEGMISREQPAAPAPSLEEQVTAIVEKVLAARVPAEAQISEAVLTVTPDPLLAELRDMVRSLTEKVDELTKDREASVQEVLNDLPAKITRQQIVRPRAAIMPDSLATTGKVNMAAIAEKTLAKMEASH